MSLTQYFPGNIQWLGLAKETVRGTAATAPTAFVPLVSPKFSEHIAALADDALRGSLAKQFGQQQGMKYPELTYQTYPYMDSVYQHVLAALGNPDAVSGTADPYTHKTALLNNAPPPSYTLWYFDGSACWQIVGAQSSNLKIDAKVGSLAGIDAGWIGLSAAQVTAPANTPTGNPPMPSWSATVSRGGTALATFTELALTIKRATEPIQVLNGTQTPGAIFVGELEVNADLNGVYQGATDGDFSNFLTNLQPSLTLKLAPAGDATHSLTVQCSKVAYTDSSFSGTNKWMEVQSKLAALANATDALDSNLSPCQAVFTTPASTAF